MRFLRLVLLATILGPPAVARAQSTADEQAIRTLPKDFCAAWAKHDGHELAIIVENTNAILGIPPELQDIKTPIAIPGTVPSK